MAGATQAEAEGAYSLSFYSIDDDTHDRPFLQALRALGRTARPLGSDDKALFGRGTSRWTA
jgi:hypothetical protein